MYIECKEKTKIVKKQVKRIVIGLDQEEAQNLYFLLDAIASKLVDAYYSKHNITDRYRQDLYNFRDEMLDELDDLGLCPDTDDFGNLSHKGEK